MRILIIIFFHLLIAQTYAQAPMKINAGVQSQVLLAGELNSTYDFIIGPAVSIDVGSNNKWIKTLEFSGFTDIGVLPSRLITINLSAGIKKYLNQKLYLKLTVGSVFYQEEHKISFVEKEKVFSDNNFGFLLNFKAAWELKQQLDLALSAHQFHLHGTSIGLSLNYKIP